MAPLHRQNSQYGFQYSIPQAPSGVSYVMFRSLSAPYRVRSAHPTVTRTFKYTPRVNARRLKETLKRDVTPGSQRERTSSPMPPPSPILPNVPLRHVDVSSRAKTPDTESQADPSSTPRKDKGVLRIGAPTTRAASRTSAKNDVAVEARKATKSNKRPGPPAPEIPIWTRFGIKNGTPVFMRRERTSSSTDRDCVTAYYESFSLKDLRTPPNLSEDPELEEGDIYINTVHSTAVTQMWIWTRDGGRVAFWKVAREGDVRDDGRRLSITPTLRLPSWVKPEWCMRQLLKQQKDIK